MRYCRIFLLLIVSDSFWDISPKQPDENVWKDPLNLHLNLGVQEKYPKTNHSLLYQYLNLNLVPELNGLE